MSIEDQLLLACETGDLQLLERILKKVDKDAVLSMRDSQTWPLLAIAASRGHEALVRRLLDLGCPVDVTDDYGSTPLYRAVGFRQNHVVKLLLAAGADVCHVNKDGNNVIHNSAYVCNDFATIAALRGGVDPTQPNAVNRISLLDLVENQPHLALVYLDTKVQRLTNYVQYSKMLYDFTGLDYKDTHGVMDSPLEAMVGKPTCHFLLSHMLVKQYMHWQWRLYGRKHFVTNLVQHVIFLVLVTYVAITSKYVMLDPGGELYEYPCCSDGSQVMLSLVRAAAELLLLPLCAWNIWGEWQEYRRSGHTQIRVEGNGAMKRVLRLVFRRADDIHQTQATVVAVPRYFLDVWNVADLGAQLLIIALAAVRVAALAEKRPVISDTGASYCLAVLVVMVWIKLLGIAGVFRTTGPKLRVLRRMLLNLLDFSVLYLLFFLALSVALFLVMGGEVDANGEAAAAHSTMLASCMSTFQITLANGDYQLYEGNGFGVVLYISWTILSTLLLLSLLIAILSYDFQTGVELAEQEWLVVYGGYLLRLQRLIGDEVVQRLKTEDLERCHAMGGFATPVGEAKTNLPALHRGIPAKLYIMWEDTTAWPPAFRKQMERGAAGSLQDDALFERAAAEAEEQRQAAHGGLGRGHHGGE
ncbi:hypothetical protein CHLRE_10g422750v5 [Chlamydomonas reinhardtii]|uniref:Ion transport domain-containing protein n=1 Tax=Chlamydomonas reinhardtii TaxID=3055 RepID=A0A2K3D9A7_CHLRE|nr:uncharacterized protein CHLRE_10g422750v5 [Chlamydomonas reinhardtii]PNW77116.1 hypothetical protein CHLRE_10g422750v5 [Chlamydomonas reinhardtii]